MQGGVVADPIAGLERVGIGGPFGEAQRAAVGVHDPFGYAGGPGCIQNVSQVLLDDGHTWRIGRLLVDFLPGNTLGFQTATLCQADQRAQGDILGHLFQGAAFVLVRDQSLNPAVLDDKFHPAGRSEGIQGYVGRSGF